MFDDLRASDGTLVAVASKNDLLEAMRNAVLEAIGSRPSTSIDLTSLGITAAQRTNRLFQLNLFVLCSILRDNIFLFMGEISVHFNTKRVPNEDNNIDL